MLKISWFVRFVVNLEKMINHDLGEYAFGGIHVISPTLFRYMEEPQWSGKFSIVPFYLSVCDKVRIEGCPLQGFHWFDIGKPETLAKAEAFLQKEVSE